MVKKIFSGVQPTGNLHLGNYLGAIKNFVDLQNKFECIYCIVDLHAITNRQNPKELKSNILETVATFVASGLNSEKNIIFNQAIDNRFDAVISMYHDQGHIPVKVYGFEESITVNLGLPLIRTSVDHGTAFDIAWKGIADNTSMVEAIKLAQNLISGSNLGN